jgi:hypothetical protein
MVSSVFERKILRKNIQHHNGPTQEWEILTNEKMFLLYQEPHFVAKIKQRRLRWMGHFFGAPKEADSRGCTTGRVPELAIGREIPVL